MNAIEVTRLFWTGKDVLVPSYNGLFQYDPTAAQWLPFTGPAFNYYSRDELALAWTGTSVVAFGYSDGLETGYTLAPKPTPVAVSYDVQTGVFKNISLQGAPSTRSGSDVLWTGSRVLVWGGGADEIDANNHITALSYNDGGLYDPVSDTWTAIPPSTTSPPRYAESTVWTGTDVLIWGGEIEPAVNHLSPTATTYPPSIPATSGAAYNPTTRAWRAMSTKGQPSARNGHAAVWTGTEMVIWGGGAYPNPNLLSSVLADGAAYNPATDTWRPIRPAPDVGLYGPTVVWTGTEMIVWGGSGMYASRNVGYRYTPATDSWQYMTTVGAPTPRVSAGGVWTGKSFLVWGGISDGDGSAPFTDGAQWFPEAADGG